MKKYKLGDIADIIGGVTYDKKDIVSEGIRILRGGNIQNNTIILKNDDVFLPDSYYNISNALKEFDTVIVASTGSVDVLGKSATVFSPLNNIQIGAFLRIIRPKKKEYASLIAYYLRSRYFRNYIQKQAKGTSINNIRNEYLENFYLHLPDDSMIENFSTLYENIEKKLNLNRAINHNLAAMAKQLYDYWFVQFDFPNQDGKPYKSSGGKMVWNEKLKKEIPEEWDSSILSEISDITMGQSPEGSSYNEKKEGIIFYQGSADFGAFFPSIRQYTTSPIRFAMKGDVLMSVRAPVGIVNIANNDCCIGRGLVSLRSKDSSTLYIYYLLKQLDFVFQKRNINGTTFGSITKDDLSQLPIIKPCKEIIVNYEKVCSSIFNKLISIDIELGSLTKQRDELLPLLMNGQVTIG